MARFFTSDLHFGHVNIIQFCARPVRDVDEMNELIVDNWNAVVSPDDEVFVLGDVCMGKIAETLPLVGLLNGTKHLIAGNHDRCWAGLSKGVEAATERYLDAGFATVRQKAHVWIQTQDGDSTLSWPVLLNHFPYEQDDRHGSKYAEHHPVDRGMWLIHGHVHTEWLQRGRQINVGVDKWALTPVSEEQIAALITAGPNDIY